MYIIWNSMFDLMVVLKLIHYYFFLVLFWPFPFLRVWDHPLCLYWAWILTMSNNKGNMKGKIVPLIVIHSRPSLFQLQWGALMAKKHIVFRKKMFSHRFSPSVILFTSSLPHSPFPPPLLSLPLFLSSSLSLFLSFSLSLFLSFSLSLFLSFSLSDLSIVTCYYVFQILFVYYTLSFPCPLTAPSNYARSDNGAMEEIDLGDDAATIGRQIWVMNRRGSLLLFKLVSYRFDSQTISSWSLMIRSHFLHHYLSLILQLCHHYLSLIL